MGKVRQEERDQALVEIWDRRLREGWTAKADFTAAAAEVDSYFKGGEDPFFSSEACAKFLDFENMPHVTVNTAFQIRGWLAPNLYQRNPTRTVTARTKDSILAALAKVIAAYLNYTPHEAGLAAEKRFGVDESLLSGRSCLYTGYRTSIGLVTSWFVSIDDVVIDPTAKRPKDAYWVAVRRRLPRWELEKEYEEAENFEGESKDTIADGVSDDSDRKLTDEVKGSELDEEETEEDLVTFYEIYSRMGIGWRGADLDEEIGTPDDQQNYRKIVIVDGHPKPLFVGRWESSLYVDEVWPFTFLDLTPTKNSLWPVSLMKAALPSQRAVNLLTSIALEKAKQHAREIYAVSGQLDPDSRERILQGGMSVAIDVKGNGDPNLTIQQLIQRWEGGQISPEIREQINFHLGQIGEITGLLPILKGQSSEQQIRSATEADIKDRNARSRLQDLSEIVEDWSTRVARNEGLLCRLELKWNEVSKILDTLEGLDLGYKVVVSAYGVPIPTRLYAPGNDVRPEKEKLCVQGLVPEAAMYFSTEAEAQQAAMFFQQVFEQASLDYLMRTGTSPYVDNVTVRRVTVKDVWDDTAYLNAADLAREIAFRVEAGSTKRPDANKTIDQANSSMQLVGQPALQAGDVATYNKVLTSLYEALQFPPKMRILLPPPPQLMPGQGGPPMAGPTPSPPPKKGGPQ